MPLPDEDPGVVDALGEPTLEDLRLQPPLQKVLHLEGKNVIEPHPLLVQDSNANQSTDEGISLEETLGVLLLQLEELSGSTTDLGEDQGNSPDFPAHAPKSAPVSPSPHTRPLHALPRRTQRRPPALVLDGIHRTSCSSIRTLRRA